jgi:predicted TIM-barrel fold metal-dependent hydrolase
VSTKDDERQVSYMKKDIPHPDFPVIDAHVHLYPDALAPKVVPMLSARFGNPPAFNGTIAECATNAAAAGVSLSINLPVATAPDHVGHTNAFWSRYAAKTKGDDGAVMSLAALHPKTPDAANEVGNIARRGFAGIKFHPEYQNFRFNDSTMDDIWAAMAETGLVAYLHAGGERVFSPPFHSSPSEILTLHRRFPQLKIAAAHLGGFGMWDEVEETLIGEDVILDLSHTFFWMPNDRILRMIRTHGAGRILFGTDAPWQDPARVLSEFLKLPLSDKDRRTICYETANERFLSQSRSAG